MINFLDREIKTFISEVKENPGSYLAYSIPVLGPVFAIPGISGPIFHVETLVSVKETEFRQRFAIQRTCITIHLVQAIIFIGTAILCPFASPLIPKALFEIAYSEILLSGLLLMYLGDQKKYNSFKMDPESYIQNELKRYHCYSAKEKMNILTNLELNRATLFI